MGFAEYVRPRHMNVDIETFSDEDIGKAGLYRYAQSPAFEVLLFAYSLDGGPVQVIDLTETGGQLPEDVTNYLLDPHITKHAYNAPFEWFCLSQHLRLPENGREAWLSQWQCTMLHGMYCGYPAGLEAAGKALGLSQDKQKLTTGKALIKYFCVPCGATKSNGGRTRNLPHHDPEKWQLFKEYNAQDVVTEMEIERILSSFPVPDFIWGQWETDQLINSRGVAVDLDLMEGALYLDDLTRQQYIQEAKDITGLENPNSLSQLAAWLTEETGLEVSSLTKDAVTDLLDSDLDSEKARRVLQIRQELGKTSNKKYNALEAAVGSDGRVRGLLQFYGANRTGRWAGRIVQPQNLPRTYIESDMLPLARDLVKDKQQDGLRMVYGSVPDTLSQLIRTAFVAKPGSTLVDADFSAIEARMIAWLADEEWVLDVFRTHGKIYEASASQMFGIPIDLIKKGNPEYSYRQKGKVATLALGYQGGTGSLVSMGALRMGIPEEDLPDIVDRWRKANSHIVEFWWAVDSASREAVSTGKSIEIMGGRLAFAREIDSKNGLDFMTIRLPNGRKLYYPHPHMGLNRFGNPSLCYWGQNQTTKKWQVIETYGGKLAENITQAVARDCLAEAVERLEAAGYHIVFHIHDEIVVEVEGGTEADLDKVVEIMSVVPPWATGLPLNADGWVNSFFKKD